MVESSASSSNLDNVASSFNCCLEVHGTSADLMLLPMMLGLHPNFSFRKSKMQDDVLGFLNINASQMFDNLKYFELLATYSILLNEKERKRGLFTSVLVCIIPGFTVTSRCGLIEIFPTSCCQIKVPALIKVINFFKIASKCPHSVWHVHLEYYD